MSEKSTMSEIRFDDQVVIVTGAGGGLGRAYALDIARRGGCVVVNDLGGTVEGHDASATNTSATPADAVVEEITAAGGRAVANYDSVADAAGAENIVAAALTAFGRVDALINNAGNMRMAQLEESEQKDFDALLSVHLLGSYHMSKAVWPHMKQRGYGRIVFTASSAGLFGNPGQAFYGAAKAGVFGLMNTLSHEGLPHGILCNVIMPNAFSRMTEKASEFTDPEALQRASAILPLMQNSMQPEFNAGLATYLASEKCSTTHGAYSACGGRIARVFVGVTEGWQGSREVPASAEEIEQHFERICDPQQGIHIPLSPSDEYRTVLSKSAPACTGTGGGDK